METRTHKGIEYSRVMLSELSDELRCDSEFYQSYHITFSDRIKQKETVKVKSFADVTDGIHASIEFDLDSSVNLISAKAPKDNYFDLSATGYIAAEQHSKNPRTALRLNDVVISTVGTIGNCAVVNESILPANSDRHVGIIRIVGSRVLPHYLSTYLLTRYGKSATVRETAGNVQPNLYIRNIKLLNIPIPNHGFQLRISQLISQAYEEQCKSEQLYQDAEKLLLNELGLDDWRPKMRSFTHGGVKMEVEENYSTVNLSNLLKSDRLDAEFWDAAALNLLDKLNNYPNVRLGSETRNLNGFPFQSKHFLENESGEPFIRIRDCKPFFIKNERLSQIDADYVNGLNVKKAQAADIVIGMDGIKWFYGSLVMNPAYVNQRVCHIRVNENSRFTPEYLLIVINSKVGQMQLLRQMTIADTVGHIKNTDVAKLIIPDSIHIDEITSRARVAVESHLTSQRLLALAKQAVERYIEEDEAAALSLIDSQL